MKSWMAFSLSSRSLSFKGQAGVVSGYGEAHVVAADADVADEVQGHEIPVKIGILHGAQGLPDAVHGHRLLSCLHETSCGHWYQHYSRHD